MKKIISVLLFTLCLLLVGCDSNDENAKKEKYKDGIEAMSKADYNAAIECFSGLDYQDSKDLLDKCKEEKGKHEKSDYAFLETMGESLMLRYEMAEENVDVQKCVETELEMIYKYKDAEFFDSKLQELANEYIKGVEIEKQSLSEEHGQQQLKYYEGHAKRFDALKKLTDNYGFLVNNVDYKVNYYNKAEIEIGNYTAIQEIEADLNKQFGKIIDFKKIDDVNGRIRIKNNTQYNYDMSVHFIFKDSDGAITYTNDMYYEDVKAGEKYNLDFYYPENAEEVEFYTEEYIQQ